MGNLGVKAAEDIIGKVLNMVNEECNNISKCFIILLLLTIILGITTIIIYIWKFIAALFYSTWSAFTSHASILYIINNFREAFTT